MEARSLAQDNSGLSSNDDYNVIAKKRTRKPITYKTKETLLIPSPPTHISEGALPIILLDSLIIFIIIVYIGNYLLTHCVIHMVG